MTSIPNGTIQSAHADRGTRSGYSAICPNVDFATTTTNTAVTIDARANDAHTLGTPFTITQVADKPIVAGGAAITLATGATVQLTLAGQLLFTPATGQAGTDIFTYTINDGTGTTDVAYVSVNIGTNTPPIIDLNDNGTTAGRDNAVSYAEGSTPVVIATATASIIDPNDSGYPSLNIALGSFVSAGNEQLAIGGTIFTYGTAQTAIVTQSGINFSVAYNGGAGISIVNAAVASEMPDAALEALIRGITYQHTGDVVADGNRTLAFTVNDGQADSNIAVATIAVTAVNDAPVNTLPSTLTAGIGVANVLTGLSVVDPDSPSGSASITTVLTVTAGTLSVTSGGGVTVTGSGTSSVALTGTIADINAYLSNGATAPTFTPTTIGTVTLTMVTNDGGNIGSGGALTDTDISTITITVVPILDLNSGVATSSGSPTIVTTDLVTNGTLTLVTSGVPNNWTEGGEVAPLVRTDFPLR